MNELKEIKHTEINIRKNEFRCIRNILNREQLYKGDPILLMYVASHDGKTQSEIARELCIKPASLTVMVKRMEQAGLIIRRADEKDMRITRVFISEAGRKTSRKTARLFGEVVEQIYQGVSEEQLKIYYSVLKIIEKNLERLAGSSSPNSATMLDRSDQREC